MRAIAVLLASALPLAGCSAEADGICTAAPSLKQSLEDRDRALASDLSTDQKFYMKIAKQEAYAISCIQHWSYRLAKSSDPADVAARAAVGGCYDAISNWTNAVAVSERHFSSGREPMVVSDRTGAYVRPEVANREKLHDYALFYVVQARAGKCPIT